MRKCFVTCISLLLAFSLAACSRAPEAKKYISDAGGFSVMTPTHLTETVQPLETEAGKIDLHLFSGQRDDTGYFVSYCDYPQKVGQQEDVDQVLDRSRDGAVANVSGRLIRETKITLMGHPGRELVIETGNPNGPRVRLRGRLFIVRNRMYQIMVVAPRSWEGAAGTVAFLQSFKLLGGPKTPDE